MTKTLTEADLRQFTGSETHGIATRSTARCFSPTEQNTSPTPEALIGCSTKSPLPSVTRRKSPPKNSSAGSLPSKADRTATLVCDDGNGRVVFSKQIEFTDFSLDTISLYFTNNTILLPSEY